MADLSVYPTAASQAYNFIPPDQNLIAWSFDPAIANTSSTPLATAGTLYVMKVHVPASGTVTNIVTCLTTAGGTLTSGQCFGALYQAGALLGQTADQAAAWASTGLKTAAIAGGAVAIAQGDAYIAFWFNGTTGPAFNRGNGTAAINAGLSAATSRFGTADTGKTTTAPGTLGTIAALSVAYWTALS